MHTDYSNISGFSIWKSCNLFFCDPLNEKNKLKKITPIEVGGHLCAAAGLIGGIAGLILKSEYAIAEIAAMGVGVSIEGMVIWFNRHKHNQMRKVEEQIMDIEAKGVLTFEELSDKVNELVTKINALKVEISAQEKIHSYKSSQMQGELELSLELLEEEYNLLFNLKKAKEYSANQENEVVKNIINTKVTAIYKHARNTL